MKTDLTGNLAVGKPTTMSSTHKNYYSSRAVDGTRDSTWLHRTCSQTLIQSSGAAWWKVDLQAVYLIREVIITNRDIGEIMCIFAQSIL